MERLVEESELLGEWYWDYFIARPGIKNPPARFTLSGFGAGVVGSSDEPLSWYTTDNGELRMTWRDSEGRPTLTLVRYPTRHPIGNVYNPMTPEGSLHLVGWHYDYNWGEVQWLDHRGKQTSPAMR